MRQLLGFGVVGLAASLLNFAVYYLLVFLSFHHLVASPIGYIAGTGLAYVLNTHLVFTKAVEIQGRLVRYVVMDGLALFSLLLILQAMVEVGLSPLDAYPLSVVVIFLGKYFLARGFVFPSDRDAVS